MIYNKIHVHIQSFLMPNVIPFTIVFYAITATTQTIKSKTTVKGIILGI